MFFMTEDALERAALFVEIEVAICILNLNISFSENNIQHAKQIGQLGKFNWYE